MFDRPRFVGRLIVAGITVAVGCTLAPAAGAAGVAPGAPGASANWTTGNKQGLGTATTRDSKVWYTLSGGALSEVYFPRGDRANVRSLEFAVTDGSSFADRESEDTDACGPARGPALADLPAGQHREVGPLSHHQDLRDGHAARHGPDAGHVRAAGGGRLPPVHPL